MTGHQINSLVGDLVAMAQAMERLPQVEAELVDARNVLTEMDKAQDSLKADLEQSRSYAATLEAKVHAAEASRDDAELRFLELDEKVHLANGFVGSVEVVLGQLKAQLAPPAPQPEPIISEVKPITEQERTEIEAIPMQPRDHQIGDILPQGQSEADPTSHVETSIALPQSPVAEPDGASSPSWATPTPPKPQPYAGLCYFDIPGYITLQEWLEGGGKQFDYFHRWSDNPAVG